MKHFLAIADLSRQQVQQLLSRAQYFKTTQQFPIYSQYTLANLLYENSTRTRISFELAAKRLSMNVVSVDLSTSSEVKGEVIEDTCATLVAMGIQFLVIRHQQEGLPKRLSQQFGHAVHVVNAGDGQHAHPSQAMLDLMTIVEKKPDLNALKIVIVGDIRHSRVANSLQCLFKLMGVGELVLVAPTAWQPEVVHYGEVTDSLALGLKNADVVIALRVQKERLTEPEQLDLSSYRQQFALTKASLRGVKADALIMHPGPINRGVEIDSEIADGPQSVILTQVENGVYMRMAILEALL